MLTWGDVPVLGGDHREMSLSVLFLVTSKLLVGQLAPRPIIWLRRHFIAEIRLRAMSIYGDHICACVFPAAAYKTVQSSLHCKEC